MLFNTAIRVGHSRVFGFRQLGRNYEGQMSTIFLVNVFCNTERAKVVDCVSIRKKA